jgi:signal transduction histidine kinase/AmiR/NasT family two-component response regulator
VLGFALCGVLPAVGVIATVLTEPRFDASARLLTAAMTLLAIGFALAGARQTLAEGRRLDAALHDLAEARERAETAAAAKAEFLANMTHELRTPLNAIIGFAGVLEGARDLPAASRRHAGLINAASATLLGVVNEVLDFSKLESGAFELDPQPFEPAAIAAQVLAMVEDQALSRGLELRLIGDGPGGRLLGDAARLRQVLLNLVGNALKFTAEGYVEVQVAQAHIDEAHRRLRIEVRDSGIGVPEEQQRAIFERFSQADASVTRRFGGTGLGLAICKRLIELMGGRIEVTSRPGEGSVFWFELELPLAGEIDEAGPAGAEAPALARPVRLLLAEDVDVNRELVRVILEPFDIEIDTVADGAQAVEQVARADYDLVLMDVQMPVMDGLSAARAIRARGGRFSRLPIVAMTANVLPEQIERCLDAGMNGHLGKPIEPRALLETIAAWSHRAEAEALSAAQEKARLDATA